MADAPKGRRHSKKHKHDAFEWLTLATAVVGVAVVLAYTCVSYYQAWVTRDTEIKQLRAYLTITAQNISPPNTVTKAFVTLKVHNSGQTPAFEFHSNGAARIFDAHLPADVHLGGFNPSYFFPKIDLILGAGQEFPVEVFTDREFSSDEIDAVEDGSERRLYFFGSIYYSDIFGYPRYTNFCFYLIPQAFPGAGSRQLQYCDRGNEAR